MNILKILNKVFITLTFVSITLMSCDPTKHATKDPLIDDIDTNVTAIMYADTIEADRSYFNNICEAENIPSELTLWGNIVMRNDIDGTKTLKYFYVNDNSDTFNVVLKVLQPQDTLFVVEIRKLEIIEKK